MEKIKNSILLEIYLEELMRKIEVEEVWATLTKEDFEYIDSEFRV